MAADDDVVIGVRTDGTGEAAGSLGSVGDAIKALQPPTVAVSAEMAELNNKIAAIRQSGLSLDAQVVKMTELQAATAGAVVEMAALGPAAAPQLAGLQAELGVINTELATMAVAATAAKVAATGLAAETAAAKVAAAALAKEAVAVDAAAERLLKRGIARGITDVTGANQRMTFSLVDLVQKMGLANLNTVSLEANMLTLGVQFLAVAAAAGAGAFAGLKLAETNEANRESIDGLKASLSSVGGVLTELGSELGAVQNEFGMALGDVIAFGQAIHDLQGQDALDFLSALSDDTRRFGAAVLGGADAVDQLKVAQDAHLDTSERLDFMLRQLTSQEDFYKGAAYAGAAGQKLLNEAEREGGGTSDGLAAAIKRLIPEMNALVQAQKKLNDLRTEEAAVATRSETVTNGTTASLKEESAALAELLKDKEKHVVQIGLVTKALQDNLDHQDGLTREERAGIQATIDAGKAAVDFVAQDKEVAKSREATAKAVDGVIAKLKEYQTSSTASVHSIEAEIEKLNALKKSHTDLTDAQKAEIDAQLKESNAHLTSVKALDEVTKSTKLLTTEKDKQKKAIEDVVTSLAHEKAAMQASSDAASSAGSGARAYADVVKTQTGDLSDLSTKIAAATVNVDALTKQYGASDPVTKQAIEQQKNLQTSYDDTKKALADAQAKLTAYQDVEKQATAQALTHGEHITELTIKQGEETAALGKLTTAQGTNVEQTKKDIEATKARSQASRDAKADMEILKDQIALETAASAKGGTAAADHAAKLATLREEAARVATQMTATDTTIKDTGYTISSTDTDTGALTKTIKDGHVVWTNLKDAVSDTSGKIEDAAIKTDTAKTAMVGLGTSYADAVAKIDSTGTAIDDADAKAHAHAETIATRLSAAWDKAAAAAARYAAAVKAATEGTEVPLPNSTPPMDRPGDTN